MADLERSGSSIPIPDEIVGRTKHVFYGGYREVGDVDVVCVRDVPALYRVWAERLASDTNALSRVTRASAAPLVPCREGRHERCYGEGDHTDCRAAFVLRAALGLGDRS
jgi:hypothetical protein